MRSPFAPLGRVFARGGRYDRLAARYAVEPPLPEPVHRGETILLANTMFWRNCVDVAADAGAVYLHPRPPGLGTQQAVRIPWDDVVAVERARMQLVASVRIRLADPELPPVTMFRSLWETLGREAHGAPPPAQ